jgi:hypothetical protein
MYLNLISKKMKNQILKTLKMLALIFLFPFIAYSMIFPMAFALFPASFVVGGIVYIGRSISPSFLMDNGYNFNSPSGWLAFVVVVPISAFIKSYIISAFTWICAKIGGVVDSLNYNLVIATLLTLIVLFAEGFSLNPSAGKSHGMQIIFTLSSLIGFLLFLKRKLKNT